MPGSDATDAKRRGGPSAAAPSSAPSAVAAGGGGADGGGGGGMRRVSSATCRGLRVEYSLLSRPRPSLSVPSSTPLYRATPRAPERASCTPRGAPSVPPYWRSVRNGSRRISQYGSGRKLTKYHCRNRFTSAASQPRSATQAPSTTRPSFLPREIAQSRGGATYGGSGGWPRTARRMSSAAYSPSAWAFAAVRSTLSFSAASPTQ